MIKQYVFRSDGDVLVYDADTEEHETCEAARLANSYVSRIERTREMDDNTRRQSFWESSEDAVEWPAFCEHVEGIQSQRRETNDYPDLTYVP